MNKKTINILVIMRVITGLMLLLALADHPYSYYQILRWVVVIVAGCTAYFAYKQQMQWWAGGMIIIAILFNPIVPFYFDRGIWILFDLIVAALFFISIFVIKQNVEIIKRRSKIMEFPICEGIDEEEVENENKLMMNDEMPFAKQLQREKYCSECRMNILPEDKFCHECGNKF